MKMRPIVLINCWKREMDLALRVARGLDDALLQTRFNELEIGAIVFKSLAAHLK